MLNEKLVSSVFFRGTRLGTAELTIQDTSNPPSYGIKYFHVSREVPNAQNVQIGRNTIIELKQSPIAPDSKQVYYTVSGDDSYRFRVIGTNTTTGPADGSLMIDDTGIGIVALSLHHYPNTRNVSFAIDFFHDVARTVKFASVIVGSPETKNPKIQVRPLRNLNVESPTKPESIFLSEWFDVSYKDENSEITWNPKLPFTLRIDGGIVQPGYYVDTSPGWITGNVNPDINLQPGLPSPSFSAMMAKRNPLKRGNVNVEVFMGDISATNKIFDVKPDWLRGFDVKANGPWLPTMNAVVDPIPVDSNDIYNSNKVSIGYAFRQSNPVPQASVSGNPPWVRVNELNPAMNYLSQLVTERKPDQNMLIRGTGSNLNRGTSEVQFSNTHGRIQYLAWEHNNLDTLSKRKQLGKYQKTLSLIWVIYKDPQYGTLWKLVRSDVAVGGVIPLSQVADAVADMTYGPLTSLMPDKVAIFSFNSRDVSLANNGFAVTTSFVASDNSIQVLNTAIKWDIANLPLPPATSDPNSLQFRSDLLFIRPTGPDAVNTFEADTAYPRIVNVQTTRGYEAFAWTENHAIFWDFVINPNLGIDLTDNRYSFITTVYTGTSNRIEFFLNQTVTMVARSPHKVTFMIGERSTNPTLALAIVDVLGYPSAEPNAVFSGLVGGLNYGGVEYTLAGTFKPTGAKVGNLTQNYSKTSNYSFYLETIQASNSLSTTTYTDGIDLLFYNDIGGHVEDSESYKPTELYVTISSVKHKLVRLGTNGTNSHKQSYVIPITPGNAERTKWRQDLANAKVNPFFANISLF